MGRTTRSEKGVLKLVHPGKRIETFTKPISAAEVLNKYPKYCITRPDVFRFPWIVVKPDSVLVPGKVFFLVPKRTIYRLLKAREEKDMSPPPPPPPHPRCRSSETHPLPGPLTANAGMTPKHETHHPRRENPTYQNREKPPEQEGCGRRTRKQSQIESWPPQSQMIGSNRSVRYYSSHVHDCYRCGNVASGEVSLEEVGIGNGGAGKKNTTSLKSCMRKPGSAPRLVNPRVRFSIPGEDMDMVEPVTKQRTVMESLSRLAASLVVDVCK